MNRFTKITIGAAIAVVAVSGTAVATAAVLHQSSAPKTTYVAHAATSPQTNPESLFVPVAPCRAIDTRKSGIIKPSQVQNFYLAGTVGFAGQGGVSGGCGIPLSATAVAVSFKVVNPTATGYLRVWPDGTPQPNATTLSWIKGASLGDSSTTPITAGPGPDISARVFGNSAYIVADVTGYFAPQIEAQIAAGGAISTGTARVVSVSHTTNSGVYNITLDRPARECSINAVTYNIGRYASVGLTDSSTPNKISVYVWHLNTSAGVVLEDYSFFLQVMC